ncbi:hypothetical protein [Methylobacterium persicinum]|uniref:Uncharacterized protein n=1 Tax=Methylobacterium persicinum TaxID=374426 RepID=A0ABU0HUR1_9HYPH|nr:hypothetical protein [Methylobacterium persicinum]MDQ0445241.1 hypothetical protein [Methylobacterium persicinum]GJE37866.1 hypothetical protein KHHGKMAE_1928 [Methylobacterium persicinum]
MIKRETLAPGWLAEELAEAPSDLALSMPPELLCSEEGRQRMPEQLDAEDACRLREKMAKRYAAWTGRDLAADLRAE